jgi:tRNA(Ile)-lysidine synthase TilS/MesJ
MSKSDVTLIRPMIWIREKDLISFAKTLPVLHNPCPANKETKREDMKNFLSEIKKQIPFAEERVLTALIHPERYNLFDKFEAEANDLHEKVMQKEQSQN